MAKWLYYFCAFICLSLFVSSLTGKLFIDSVVAGADAAKQNASQQVDVVVKASLQDIYSHMNQTQLQQIQQINSLTLDQRKLLIPGCQANNETNQPFCDSRFIAGTMTFDDIMKEGLSQQFSNATNSSIDAVESQITKYNSYNLVLIAVVSCMLGLILYVAAKGTTGLQMFFGNLSWLFLLSALSFKTMPALINKLVSSANLGNDPTTQKIGSVLIGVVVDWMKPAMNHVAMVSIILAIICLVVWVSMKVFRNYDVSVN